MSRVARRPPVILVADDEAAILYLVASWMEREGYQVIPASDGHEALELSREFPGKIDLVITDMEMPRLNGSDLCSHLLEERPGIKALVMSGEDLDKLRRDAGPLPMLPKPFDPGTLRAKVRALLDTGEAP
jgi:CheY-like chemotaxis protein